MYNKISSIILNSGSVAGTNDVFIAQPDAVKENLAGKVFVMAEISGKKNDSQKIFNFLVANLNDNYYNDEKILWRDKIEGLKIENIFEAALAKTNKSLNDFLLEQKIKLNLALANITLGVVCENKLYFSNFGKNRSFLIYFRNEKYEIINVEANATDIAIEKNSPDKAIPKAPVLFSSVISGEIPHGSYFVFTSEALPEYLSSSELISIITKLPPIVAAEQIKNVLSKINNYVPFLGIIIKNVAGLNNLDSREIPEEIVSAQTSISSLNYTEQKTEQMLAPAGLISFSKIINKFSKLASKLKPKPTLRPKKVYRPEEDKKIDQATFDFGKINTLSLLRPESFSLKEKKVVFKHRTGGLWRSLQAIFQAFIGLFSFKILINLGRNFKIWLKNLNKKNRLIFLGLAVVVIIFVISILITNWRHQQQAAAGNFNNLIAQITEKETLIDSHLLYNDDFGAQTALEEAQALLASLPQDKKSQKEAYNSLADKLKSLEDRVWRLTRVGQAAKINDISGLGIASLVFADGKIYAAGLKNIYIITPNSSSSTKIEVSSANNLSNPEFDKKSLLYYWDADKVIQYDLKTKNISPLLISDNSGAADGLTSFKVFNGNLYIVAKAKNQIYRYNKDKDGFGAKSLWLKSAIDLSQATDFAIDGNIYVLKNTGEVLKMYKGNGADYSAPALSPALKNANKIVVGTKYLYIFDASVKRLAVLAIQDGHLVNQYELSSLSNPKDIAIDESGKAAYFLDGEAIYQISLNQ